VGAFFDMHQQRTRGSSPSIRRGDSSSGSGVQLEGCRTLLLGELLAALPQDLLYSGSGSQTNALQLQPPTPAAALLSYLQQHPGVFKIDPSDTAARTGAHGIGRSEAAAFAAAGASATWQVQLQQATALQLLLRHTRWAEVLPEVQAELLAMMKPHSENFPLVPRVSVKASVKQLQQVLPQLLPYLQVHGLLEAAVAAAPVSDMFGMSCGTAFQAPAATAAEGLPNGSTTGGRSGDSCSCFTHIELRPSARVAAWADGVRTCPHWRGGCPRGVLCNQSHLQPAQWLSSAQQQQQPFK
jgi:hypothetical protein